VRGVKLSSRYGKAHEYVVMQKAVLELSSGLASAVVSIFCDSKTTCVYEVVVRYWDDNGDIAHQLGQELDSILLRLDGGHNGIWPFSLAFARHSARLHCETVQNSASRAPNPGPSH